MKISTIALAVFLAVVALKPKPVTVYLIGDSIMADKDPAKYPITGWGQVLGEHFKENVTVKNKAADGRTTRTFVNEGRWKAVADSLKEGDYVLIGFGHNDEKVDLPKIGVQLPDFKNYLVNFINEARSKKAIPILLTPVSRRSFENGVFHDTHGAYADAIRAVGEQENVPVIDLQNKTEKLLLATGDEPSKKYFNWVDSAATPAYPKGSKDNTHLSALGAHTVAAFVADGIKEQHLALAQWLKE